ncbi:MAG: acyltransferase family protein [Bacteroidales bacterium]|nr:acyltransferase family protein [Bacteroidales bacterium]
MKLKYKIQGFSIEDSNIIKGVGILLIVFHNFFHWIRPFATENEFIFSIKGVNSLINGIQQQPLDAPNLILSFWGHFGVQLFLFISGYGLMKAYQNKTINWSSFVYKRISKLWPTFFFAIFLFYSFVRVFYYDYDINMQVFGAYLLKITFLSNFVPQEVFSLSGPWWFYSMIVQLYLVFPFLLSLQKKYGNIALVGISVISYIILFFFNPWFIIHYSSLYFFFLGNIPVFSLGMILASKGSFTYNRIYGIIALLVFGLSNFFLNIWYFSQLLFTIWMLALIYFSLLKGKRNSYAYKGFLFFGNISMYLFAIHGFLRRPFINLADNSNNPILTVLWAISFVVFATLIAFILKWIVTNYLIILNKASKIVNHINSKNYLWVHNASKSLIKIATIFLLISVLLRIYEYNILHLHHELVDVDINSLLGATSIDLLLSLGFIGILLIPFIGLYRLSKTLAKTLVIIIINLIIISSISLIQYYDLTLTLLDRVVYAYSLESMLELSNTTEFSLLNLMPFFIAIVLFNGSLLFTKHIKHKRLFIIFASFTAFSLGLAHNVFIPKEKTYSSETEYLYSNNKFIYFVKDLIRYKPSKDLDLATLGSSIKSYKKVFNDRKYLSLNYPFLRNPDQGDPIGSFFNKTKNGNKPNIVFIIVESLCTPVSGPYTYKTSFTPFLDSLTEHSLYWRNNLATAERTFGVLPSVLGSLPYSKKGFLDLNLDMPEHKSLINILAKNNYATRFFYGGWPHFNNMDIFMNLNNIDTIIHHFDSNDSIPPNKNGFSWGYSDGAVLESTFQTIPDSTQAYLSIYLTLSTHSPFNVKNQDYYMQRVLERLKDVGVEKKEMASYIKNQKKLSTFIYFDDELRKFFEAYKKRKDFENTIFVITGDHRGIIFDRSSQIDVYHTPLIIYSPLLKKAKDFGGISTHADITPTFINYLQNQYQINCPTEVSWQGGLLDTSSSFHSQQRMAFMRNNRDIRDYIHGNYYLASDILYRIHDTMHLVKIENQQIKAQLKKELSDFKNLNQFSFMGLSNGINTNIKNLVNLNFDFEKTIPNYFVNDTTSKEAYRGKYSLILRKNHEYGSFIPTIKLEEGITKIYFEVSFMVLIDEVGKQNPLLVASVSNQSGNLAWGDFNIMNDNFSTDRQWKKITASKTIFLKNESSKCDELKLYLWNTHGTEMYYDNIKVSIKVRN